MQDRQASLHKAGTSARACGIILSPRFFARVAKGLLATVLICLVALATTAFFLHKNPQALAQRLAETIQSRTGIACTLGMVDVVFFPVPALAVSDLQLQTDDMEAHVAYATLRPALLPLLRGEFEPGAVNLLRPRWLWRVPAPTVPSSDESPAAPSFSSPMSPESLASPTAPATPVAPATSASPATMDATPIASFLANPALPLPAILLGCNIQLQHGSLDIQQADGTRLMADSINASVRIAESGSINTDLRLGATLLLRGEDLVGSVNALQLKFQGFALDPEAAAPPKNQSTKLEVTTRLHVPKIIQNTSVHFFLTLDPGQNLPLRVQWQSKGEALWKGTPLSFTLTGESEGNPAMELALRQVRMSLDHDQLELNGALRLSGPTGPKLAGALDIQRLSLVQWFGFGRQLPPGLQNTLHQLRGALRFDLDATGLDVPHISVQADDGLFTGKGGVPSWAQPVIVLELAASALTLDTAFPEAAGADVPPPSFAHPPLTPKPGSPEALAMPGPDLGYDINLRVSTLKAWGLSMNEVSFRCLPGSAGAQGEDPAASSMKGLKGASAGSTHGVLMHFGAGHLYGGRGEGRLLLRTLPGGQTGYAVKATLKNVNAEQPALRFGGSAWLGGRLSLETDFTASGKTIAAFLASQEGVVNLRLENGYVRQGQGKDAKLPFGKVQVEGRAKGENPMENGAPARELAYTGQWKATLDAPEIKANVQIEGPLVFGGKNFSNVQLRKTPGHISLHLAKGLSSMPEDLKIDAHGRFSLQSAQRTVSIEDAQIRVPTLGGLTLAGQGQASFNAQDAQWKIKMHANAPDAPRLLRLTLPAVAAQLPPGSLHKAEAQGEIHYANKSLTFKEARLKLDDMTMTGHGSGQWSQRPLWKFEFAVDTLDLDRFFPPRPAPKDGKDARKAKATPWNLQWMREHDVQGSLRVQELRVRKFSLRKAHFPLRLQSGVVQTSPATGDLYGSTAHINFKGEALPQGLKMQVGLESQNMNLLAMSEGRAMRTALAGRGALWLRMQGTAKSAADIPACFDGGWRMQVSEGFMQERTPRGVLTGSRTTITNLQASGSMEKGVLRSDNLILQGPTMTATGAGWVNLVNDSLDVNLVVDMRNLPAIPVRFHGSLEKPERSIKPGAVLANTLGSLGSGVVDVLGGVLGGVMKLF